jgi:hypothetical protein
MVRLHHFKCPSDTLLRTASTPLGTTDSTKSSELFRQKRIPSWDGFRLITCSYVHLNTKSSIKTLGKGSRNRAPLCFFSFRMTKAFSITEHNNTIKSLYFSSRIRSLYHQALCRNAVDIDPPPESRVQSTHFPSRKGPTGDWQTESPTNWSRVCSIAPTVGRSSTGPLQFEASKMRPPHYNRRRIRHTREIQLGYGDVPISTSTRRQLQSTRDR